MTDIKNKLEKIIPLSKTNLFYKNKLILTANTLKNLEKDIRDNINKPKKDKNVFVIRVVYDPKDKSNVLTISCSKKIITTDLELNNVIGSMKNIIYTLEDFENIGFTKSHINKIIKVVDKKLLTKKITSNINDVLNVV
jgi:hypothetical protein